LEEIKPGRELTRAGWRFLAAGLFALRARKFCGRRRISVRPRLWKIQACASLETASF